MFLSTSTTHAIVTAFSIVKKTIIRAKQITMLFAILLLGTAFPVVSPLITPIRGSNGEPDLDGIINHLTLLEQNMAGLTGLKTQVSVLESKLERSESEIARLTSELGTCTTDIAVVKTQVQSLQSLNDCCQATKMNVFNLTLAETYLRNQVTNLNNALADVYNKSTSNSKFLNSIHGMHDLVTIDGWVLAFRAQADINSSVYDTWMNDAIYHDNPLLPWLVGPECQSLQTSHPCRVHYKSKIVPLWQTVNIQQVKVLLIKNSQIRQQILFDGVGTTKTNWFARDRVINSTWTDLKTAPMNFFSIQGDGGNVHRRFFINSLYNGCPGDQNWLTVIDAAVVKAPGECNWDMVNSIPKIMYSRRSTRSTTSTDLHDFEFGDVMAILVKLGDM